MPKEKTTVIKNRHFEITRKELSEGHKKALGESIPEDSPSLSVKVNGQSVVVSWSESKVIEKGGEEAPSSPAGVGGKKPAGEGA